MTGHLREGDADRAVAVLEDAWADDSGPLLPWALLEGVRRLVPCDLEISYQRHDLRARQRLESQWVTGDGECLAEGPEEPDPDDQFWALFWTSVCSWPQRTGDLTTVLFGSDLLPTTRAWRAEPLFADVLTDVRATALVSLPAPPGEARRLCFFRGCDVPFDERDREVLALLRPHVQQMLLDGERRRDGVPELTPREWEVLGLAASGLSTAEIAGALWLSPGTVRKHAEHIRERLGVHTLAAAAAKAMPHAPPLSRRPGVPPAARSGSARSPGGAAGR
jgi:DNA-binding CsgD family transcriptional regulator